MINSYFEKLNTFGLGRWIVFESQKHNPDVFVNNYMTLQKLFKGTDICVKEEQYASLYLKDHDFFVFLDNNNKPQIIGDMGTTYGVYGLCNIRGLADKKEQNIAIKYMRVANEFFDKNKDVKHVKVWKYQTNWILRLKKYIFLFKTKQYSKINVEQLLDDLGYNGYSLHYERHYNPQGEEIEEKYYPLAKRMLFKQPYLKPLIAKHLGCKPGEIFIGKYFGNGKNIKYVVGDLMSPYLSRDCKIEKVFGNVDMKHYQGDFPKAFSLPSTGTFKIIGEKHAEIDVSDLFKNATLLNNLDEFRQVCCDREFERE